MKKSFSLLFVLAFTLQVNAQTYLISQQGTWNTCGGTFYDSGGGGASYSINENFTITFCSSSGGQISLDFTGFPFMLEDGYDFLDIWDGNTASGTPMYQSGLSGGSTNPGIITSTTGCLTIQFTSDFLLNYGGWGAVISCPTCFDGIMNGTETGVDCGGATCVACPNCFNGIQDGNETGIDCGPSCPQPCHCTDGILNFGETSIDCGGPCLPCPVPCSVTATATIPGGCNTDVVNITYPALTVNNTFSFPGVTTNVLSGTLTITAMGDLDLNSEIWTILNEAGATLTSLGGSGTQCGTVHTITIPLSAADLITWSANGTIDFFANASNTVNIPLAQCLGGEYVEMSLETCYPIITCAAINVTLEAFGQGAYNYALNNDFDLGTAGSGWSSNIIADFSNPCDPSIDGGSYMWMGNSSPHPRIIETVGLDLSCGGEICFFLDFATQGNASPCEGIDLADEGVYFEYSIDGGATWVTMEYYGPAGVGNSTSGGGYDPQMTAWNQYCLPIPSAAVTPSTLFHWAQTGSSSLDNDHWGLDNVTIASLISCSPYTYNWLQVPGLDDNPLQVENVTSTTTFTVWYGNGTDSCSTDVTVIVPPGSATITGILTTCVGDTTQLTGSGTPDGSTPWTSSNMSVATVSNTGLVTGYSAGNTNITYLDATGCLVTESVTIDGGPSYSLTSTDPSACNVPDGSILISGLSPGGSYDVTYDDGSPTTIQGAVADGIGEIPIGPLAPGTYTVTVTDNSTTCIGQPSVMVVSNLGAPSIDPYSLQTVCDSFTVPSITGISLTGFEEYYYVPGGPGGGGAPVAVGTVITSSTVLYAYDVNGACASEEILNITVNISPDVTPVVDQVACDSFPLQPITGTNLTGNEAYYDASGGPLGGGSPLSVGGTITTQGVTTVYIYDATGTSPNCYDEESFTVTINLSPVYWLTLTNPTVCDGADGEIMIEGLLPVTDYEVTYFDGTTTIGPSTMPSNGIGQITIDTLGSGTYYVTLSVTLTGCTGDTLQTALVNPVAPIIDSMASYTSCAVDYVLPVITGTNLTGSETYYDLPGGLSGGGTQYFAGGTVTSSIILYAYDENGFCFSEEPLVITINPLPDVTAVNSGPLCADSVSFTVDETGPDATSWTWGSNGSATITSTTDRAPTVTGAVDGEQFTVTGTDGNGCESSATTIITINALPTVTATNTGPYCAGEAMSVSETGPDATSWTWGSNGSAVITDTTDQAPTITDAVDGEQFTVTGTDGNGCESSATTTITINALPTVTATNTGPLCADSVSFTVDETGPDATSWTWGSNGSAVITNTTDQAPIVTGGITGEIFTVIASDANGCVDSSQTTITINPEPDADFEVSGGSCESAEFTARGIEGVVPILTWYWAFGDGNFSSDPDSATHVYTSAGIYDITLIVTSDSGCVDTVFKPSAVNAYVSPNADFVMMQSGITLDPNVTTILSPSIDFVNVSSSNVDSVIWDFGDEESGAENTSNDLNPVHVFSDTGTYIITLSVYTPEGCEDIIILELVIEGEYILFAPNAFTPNNDGFNDFFLPTGVGITGEDFDLVIYNRWGDVIREVSGIFSDDVTAGWDGKANNGTEIVQMDVYVWVIYTRDSNGGKHQYVGHVTLLR